MFYLTSFLFSKYLFHVFFRSHIFDYYRRGGKVLFLADPQHDPSLFWLLETVIKDKQLLKEVQQAFSKFATGHRVPENLQCTQIPGFNMFFGQKTKI